MDFKDLIKQHGERVAKLKEQIQTEEATKNAFIMPFIQLLGYDVFSPFEVVPEHTCDIGTKKGEKIDYAIMKDNNPILLIECKHWKQELGLHDNQLLRYYGVSTAKFGLLTNGIVYKFYTDLESTNIMDNTPFLEIDITDINELQIEELKKFHKSYFDETTILNTASNLKYTNDFKRIIISEINTPSEALVRLFSKQVCPKQITSKMIEYFTPIVKKSFNHVVNDKINDRLKSALKTGDEDTEVNGLQQSVISDTTTTVDDKKQVITTEIEMEGYYIVKSIIRETIEPDRISYKDTIDYFRIIVDGSTLKSICRLWFNGKQKYMTVNYEDGKQKFLIDTLDDLYKYKDILIAACTPYIQTSQEKQ